MFFFFFFSVRSSYQKSSLAPELSSQEKKKKKRNSQSFLYRTPYHFPDIPVTPMVHCNMSSLLKYNSTL